MQENNLQLGEIELKEESKNMRNNYVIFPETKEKLVRSGLAKRIEEASKTRKFEVLGCVSKRDIVGYCEDLKEIGFYSALPQEERKSFGKSLNELWKDIDKRRWKIKRYGGESEVEVEYDEMLFFLGWRASKFLDKTEVPQYKKFGFESLPDFFASIGAYVDEFGKKDWSRGYVWERKGEDGRGRRAQE